MDKYICTYCGYIYDPELGAYEQKIEVGTEWEQVPKTFKCQICESKKEATFEKL